MREQHQFSRESLCELLLNSGAFHQKLSHVNRHEASVKAGEGQRTQIRLYDRRRGDKSTQVTQGPQHCSKDDHVIIRSEKLREVQLCCVIEAAVKLLASQSASGRK